MNKQLLTTGQKQKIDEMVAELLLHHSIQFDSRNLLTKIAEGEGIELQEASLEDISGILYKDSNGSWRILVNEDDSPKRKVFTVAHELGHYFLHKDEQNKFVDSQFLHTCYGRAEATKYADQELEANEFAGSLIMPKAVIEQQLGSLSDEQISEESVMKLASRFEVSALAMATRLRNLGYVLG